MLVFTYKIRKGAVNMGCFGYICPVCNTQIVGDCFNGGELCRLKHVREGKVVGWTVGHYDEYGGVKEHPRFRDDDREFVDGKMTNVRGRNPNNHDEICDSEFGRADSFNFGHNRLLPNGSIMDISRSRMDSKFSLQEGEDANEVIKAYIADNIDSEDEEIKKTVVLLSEVIDLATKHMDMLMAVNKDDEGFTELFYNIGVTLNAKMKSDAYAEATGKIYQYMLETLPVHYGESGIIAVHEKCYQSLTKTEQRKLKFSMPDPDQSWGEVREEFK